MVRFDPRGSVKSIGIYRLNRTQFDTIRADVMETDWLETLFTTFFGDGVDCILSSKWFYGIRPQTAGQSYMMVGNLPLFRSGFVSYCETEFAEYFFGTIAVPRTFNDFRDWSAVTYKLYLPLIGTIDLNPDDVVGKSLSLRYRVNITDGSAVCRLTSFIPLDPTSNQIIFTETCSWGYDMPIKGDAVKDTVSLIGGIASRAVAGAAGGAAFGGAVGAAIGGIGGLATAGPNSAGQSYSSGSLAPNAGWMGDLEAKLIYYAHDDLSGNNGIFPDGRDADFKAAVGAPSGAVMTIGDLRSPGNVNPSGFVKATAIVNQGTALALPRGDEIVAMLMEGIYL